MLEFRLFTAVWGVWHVDCLLRGMLPTLLAPGNLPALAAAHGCHYKIFTTAPSAALLARDPLFDKLRATVALDVAVVAADDNVHAGMQVSWWQQGVDEARDLGGIAVCVHPDVVWSDGTFAAIGRFIGGGGKAVYLPNIRVVSETFLPALAGLSAGQGQPISLSGTRASTLALRHLHPLAAVRLPTTSHASAANEVFWPVPGAGLLMRQLTSTAIAADPNKVAVDFEFFVRDAKDLGGIASPRRVDDMLMLSLAPLAKDLGVFEFGQTLNPLHLGRWSAHPTNHAEINRSLAEEFLWLPLADASGLTCPSDAAMSESSRFMERSVAAMAATRLFHRLGDLQCKMAAGLLACALHETDLVARLDCGQTEVTVFVPRDSDAFARLVLKRLAPRRQRKLVPAILAHIAVGQCEPSQPETVRTLSGKSMTIAVESDGRTSIGGHRILETLRLDRMTVCVIDGTLV